MDIAATLLRYPLDLALEGSGFFVVQGPEGLAYTRPSLFLTAHSHSVSPARPIGDPRQPRLG